MNKGMMDVRRQAWNFHLEYYKGDRVVLNWVLKVIWTCFGFTLLRAVIGLKKLAPPTQPIRSSDLIGWVWPSCDWFYSVTGQSQLGQTRFPALSAVYVYLLRVLNGSFCCLRFLWLASVIALVLVLRHSIETALVWRLIERDELLILVYRLTNSHRLSRAPLKLAWEGAGGSSEILIGSYQSLVLWPVWHKFIFTPEW